MPTIEDQPDESQLCNERVAMCHCGKPARHREKGDYDHVCSYAPCNGSWRGSENSQYFEIVRLPQIPEYLKDPQTRKAYMDAINDEQ